MAGEGGNIVRNVFGKSYKEAEHIMKDASKGTLDFKSPQENTFYGKQGGKKFGDYESKKSDTLLVTKMDGPFDPETNKKVDVIEKGKWYNYQAVEFSRVPTKSELKQLNWGIKYDDGEVVEIASVKGLKGISYRVPKERNITKLRVYTFFKKPSDKVSIEKEVLLSHIKIVITSEITGYTIQGLKGEDYIFSDPAVIVPTYKVNVNNYDADNKKGKLEFTFNVTRDAWYNLGKNENKKYELLNRAFVPKDWAQNLYGVYWIPSYPNQFKVARSGLDAFIFTRYGNRKIPAQPLKTQKLLNGKSIEHPRTEENFATDVMIHIGGTYEVKGYDHLGGSYGCFGFIPEDDIYPTPELAKKASENDVFDDKTSNDDWKNVADKIIKLSFQKNKELRILLEYRDEKNNYYPTEVLSE
ncbi:hypothetical protein [Chryseobacterium sp.]|uniref:hypothetical protein n=1 Tax=Chryseobacterium sp. TaxID=1871047 RepID=UPI0025C234DF|nr:hypothetical protein [Chryseobacterium sp.]